VRQPEGAETLVHRRGGAAAAAVLLGLLPAAGSAAAATPVVASVRPAWGAPAGGTVVQVTGQGFTGALGVTFGDQQAAWFQVESDTSLEAAAPPAPGPETVDVRVTTPAGTSAATPSDRFTYVGTPAVSAVLPDHGPTAGGIPVTILGQGFTGATEVLFGGQPTQDLTVVSDTELVATLPPNLVPTTASVCRRGRCVAETTLTPASSAATVDVQVVTPAGASPPGPQDRFTYLPPLAVSSVSPAAGPATGGTAVTLAGTDLADADLVLFGDSPAPFAASSDGTLVATAPPGRGTVSVRVAAGPVVRQAAVGGGTSYAVLSDGSVWEWGALAPARPGETPATPGCGCTDVPEPVPGLPPAVAVAAGQDVAYALARDGTVWAWGAGGEGQLGDGRLQPSSRPVRVLGLQHVVAIAAGLDDGYALEADGSVWAWGSDTFGQLGTRAYWRTACLCSPRPVRVAGVPPAVALAAGGDTAYALTAQGQVVVWGDGLDGEAGDGSVRDVLAPAPVPGLQAVASVAAGPGDAFAVLADGTVEAWGADAAGQLGVPAPGGSSSGCACVPAPVAVPGLPPVTQVAAGSSATYALDATGAVWAWGGGSSLARVAGIPAAVAVAAGGGTALAVGADGSLWGWGDGTSGQLGGTALGQAAAPPVALPFWADVSPASASAAFTYVPTP
jgi:alpha-tubulin suppressor-like RCC1 family protein